MRKTLATVAATAAAFAFPLMTTSTSYAAMISPVLPSVGDTITVSAVDAGALIAKLGGGCTTTYEGAVLSTPIGQVIGFGNSILDVTIYGSSPYYYTFAQAGNTVAYAHCLY